MRIPVKYYEIDMSYMSLYEGDEYVYQGYIQSEDDSDEDIPEEELDADGQLTNQYEEDIDKLTFNTLKVGNLFHEYSNGWLTQQIVCAYRLPDVDRNQVISELKQFALDKLKSKMDDLQNKIDALDNIN